MSRRIQSFTTFLSRITLRDAAAYCLGVLSVAVIIGLVILLNFLHKPLAPEAPVITASWIPASVKRWHQPIETMAKKYNVDPNLIAIIMTMESGGYSKADSGEAQGLMQITPLTGHDIATKYLKQPVQKYNIWDPNTNIEFGTALLAKLRDTFGETNQGPTWNSTVELVAAAYNGGPGAANSLLLGKGLHDTQTVVYSRDAFNMWRERHASDSPTFDRWKERGGSTLIDEANAEMNGKASGT